MKINIDISDEDLNSMVEKAIQKEIDEWIHEALERRSDFRRRLEKEFATSVKEMIYEPKLKEKIIDKAVKEAAFEIRRKGMDKFLKEMTN